MTRTVLTALSAFALSAGAAYAAAPGVAGAVEACCKLMAGCC